MLNERKNHPLAEQEGNTPAVTNESCYTENSSFFSIIHSSSLYLLSIGNDSSYPLRHFCHLTKVKGDELDDFNYKHLIAAINKAEEEALKLARQCAEIRRRLNRKEAQNV